MPPLLFVFLDGVGFGAPDAEINPFAAARTPTLDALAGGSWLRGGLDREDGGVVLHGIDASLGRPGLPQSATGQTTLLTGRNAAVAMDGHYGPWPGPTLRRFLEEGNLFSWAHEIPGARQAGVPAVRLAGAYPPGFFDALERRRLRLNAPAHAARAAGVALPDLAAYRAGQAVSADLDGAHFASIGAVPPSGTGPAAAGARLSRLAARSTFTFFDVWPTDRAGHLADWEPAVALVERLDAFLGGVVEARPDGLTVLLTSDHGNLEDLSHRRHTKAPVPLLAIGPHAAAFAPVASLDQVAPAVRRVWTAEAAPGPHSEPG